jgi:hypothetical protein
MNNGQRPVCDHRTRPNQPPPDGAGKRWLKLTLYAPSYGRNPAALAFTLKAIGFSNTNRCHTWEVGHEYTRQPAYLETVAN